MKAYIYSAIVSLMCLSAHGQTCCSAGAPTSSSLDIGVDQAKEWSFQLGYEYKSINLLIDHNERLANDPRTRAGQNVSLKFDYALSNNWAFSAFLPLVYQNRATVSEQQSSFGHGDLMLLSQYNFSLGKASSLSLSGGIKLPTGVTNHTAESSLLLSPDMQSGSGTYDYLVRAALLKENFLVPFLTAQLSGTYRNNGINNHFGQTDNFAGRRFGFGDESIASMGLSYNWATKQGFITPDLTVRWRRNSANQEQNSMAPNSGGNWLSLPFGVSFLPGVANHFRVYTELPLYQSLEGLQITTDFTIGLQYRYTINHQ